MDYTTLASPEAINNTIKALAERNMEGISIASKEEALAKIKELIPAGASVFNGASVSLEEIGFVDFLKSGKHGWNNLHGKILAEKDPAKAGLLRKQSTVSDFYLGSVHALTQEGEFLIASNTGSQMPGIVFNSSNLIFVVGAQKIVADLPNAFKRLKEHVIPLEDEHMKKLYGQGTRDSKKLIFSYENPYLGRKVRVLIVNEKLGF